MDPAINRVLPRADYFSPLDIHFARLIARLSGKGSPELFLAAALVSGYRAEGHICLDLASLAGKSVELQAGESFVCPQAEAWRNILLASPVVGRPGDFRPLILDGTRLYLYRYWEYENQLIESLRKRIENGFSGIDLKLLADGLSRLFPRRTDEGTDWLKTAVFTAVTRRFCVISGGPGTGKTFTVARILALLIEQSGAAGPRIALAAPTGKAAARLQEAIQSARGMLNCSDPVRAKIPDEASTIHRLLRSLPGSPYFYFNARNLLSLDTVIIDEASMVDLALLSKLVQALPSSARLILLGDKDQLASVEAGAVLGDICDTGHDHGFSENFRKTYQNITGEEIEEEGHPQEQNRGMRDSVIRLKKSFRFPEAGGIGAVSRAVNAGESAGALAIMKKSRDVAWRELPRAEDLARALKDQILIGFTPFLKADDPLAAFAQFNRFRILCALREGPFGVRALNYLVEQIFKKEGLIRPDHPWYKGRPILITRNDYQLQLFNGDIGMILPDPEENQSLRAFFSSPQGAVRKLPPLRLPEHETVYALTVHKSQGSEFDEVLFLLPDQDFPVLTRELIYTGITRAKERVEVWSSEKIFNSAVMRRTERISGLRDAFWGRGA